MYTHMRRHTQISALQIETDKLLDCPSPSPGKLMFSIYKHFPQILLKIYFWMVIRPFKNVYLNKLYNK